LRRHGAMRSFNCWSKRNCATANRLPVHPEVSKGESMRRRAREMSVPRRAHQAAELHARHAQQLLVVAALDIDLVVALELFVDHRLHTPGHAESRHGAELA